MTILQALRMGTQRLPEEPLGTTALRGLVIAGEKGGSGKTTVTELASIVLLDAGVQHTVAECEAEPRLAKRLDVPVFHYPLHRETVSQLGRNPDLMFRYWDQVAGQLAAGPTLVDLGANALSLLLRWASTRSVNVELANGAGLGFILVATADPASLSGTLQSAKQLAHVLPRSARWIVINEVTGEVDTRHPGVRRLLEDASCQGPLRLSVCRTPHFPILRGQGGFLHALEMTPRDLTKHAVPFLEAGRALDGLRDWVLEGCDAVRPALAGLLEPAP
jgi:hypothetical protein